MAILSNTDAFDMMITVSKPRLTRTEIWLAFHPKDHIRELLNNGLVRLQIGTHSEGTFWLELKEV